jgi:hypothetical protein
MDISVSNAAAQKEKAPFGAFILPNCQRAQLRSITAPVTISAQPTNISIGQWLPGRP